MCLGAWLWCAFGMELGGKLDLRLVEILLYIGYYGGLESVLWSAAIRT